MFDRRVTAQTPRRRPKRVGIVAISTSIAAVFLVVSAQSASAAAKLGAVETGLKVQSASVASATPAQHATGPLYRPSAGLRPKVVAPAIPGVLSYLPLGTLAEGDSVTNQFNSYGIDFSGQSPFITDDGSSSTNPVISGSPLFQGTIVGTFVIPRTNTPTTVNEFSLDVGYINDPDSVTMTVFGRNGQQLGVLSSGVNWDST